MKRIHLAAATLATVFAGVATAEEMHKILKPDAIQWAPSPRLPKGAQHWRNAPAGLDQFVGRWLSRFI
jgi:hypothetical protein